ncbi:MAG: hypothetical protein ACOCXG_03180 [Nanoarchaeota archaeon]
MNNQSILTYDLETSGVGHEDIRVLQFAYIFEKPGAEKLAFENRVKFPKSWENCSEKEQDGLKYNGISSSVDIKHPELSILERRRLFRDERGKGLTGSDYYITIDEHNMVSKEPLHVIRLFLKRLEQFGKFDVLQGFNIKSFDNPIFDKFFGEYYGCPFSDLFVYDVCDVFELACKIAMKDKLVLPDGDIIGTILRFNKKREKWFQSYLKSEDYPGGRVIKHLLKLETLYTRIFGKDDMIKFHEAISDCVATIELKKYLYKLVEKDKEEFMPEFEKRKCCICGKFIVLGNDYPLYHQEKEVSYVCENYNCMKTAYQKQREDLGLPYYDNNGVLVENVRD